MNQQEISPGRENYAFAALILLAGIGTFAWLLYKNLSGLGSELQQVVVPGKAELALAKVGTYTIFYEHRSVVGNKVYDTDKSLSGLECALVSKRSGSQVPLSRATMSSTYTLGGREGTSVFEFQISQPGAYELSAGYGQGREGPEVVLAIGEDFTGRLLTTILGSLAVLFVSCGVALATFLVTFLKRSKAKKLLESRTTFPRPIE